MTIKQEASEALMFLEGVINNDRYKAVFDFAKKKRNLETGTITLLNGEIHAAAAYAMHTYINASKLADPSSEEEHASYLIVSLLMAMEITRKDHWTFGSKLLYDIRAAGIRLPRKEVTAFLAQEGTFDSNYNKYALMESNLLAVSIHCGDLMARYNTLPGLSNGLRDPNGSLVVDMLENRKQTDMNTIEHLSYTYIGNLIGQQNKKVLDGFIGWLRTSNYYTSPASLSGLHSITGGLAMEKVETIYYMAKLLLPATANQVGEIVMAAILSDLHKVGVYHDNGTGGYEYKDSLPYGEGRKSLYIAAGFFGELLPENVAAAIDAYGHDIISNPDVGLLMMEYPLALYLHVGTIAAAFLQIPRAKSLKELPQPQASEQSGQ